MSISKLFGWTGKPEPKPEVAESETTEDNDGDEEEEDEEQEGTKSIASYLRSVGMWNLRG